MPTALLLGAFQPGSLEGSYERALTGHGWKVSTHNMAQLVRRHVRFKRAGEFFQQFVAVEPWMRKVNADLVIRAEESRPDVVISFGMNEPLRVGSLAQFRAVHPSCKMVCVWPDPLVNWSANLAAMMPMFDLVATYSEATVPVFSRMGARSVAWIPLAADPELHAGVSTGAGTEAGRCDVSFIGAWRRSRQDVLDTLGDFDLKIWGPGWGRRDRSTAVTRKAWQGRSVIGAEFTAAVRSSTVNLNLIDPTCFPAANMRLFELLAAGGAQLSSSCPEFEQTLRHGEHLFYVQRSTDIPAALRDLLARPAETRRVAEQGSKEVLTRHTYADRVSALLEACGL